MKKQISILVIVSSLVVCLIVGTLDCFANQTTIEKYEINSLKELKKELNKFEYDDLNSKEMIELNNNTNPKVLEKLVNEKMKKAEVMSKQIDPDEVMKEDADGNSYGKTTMNLGDNCYAIVEFEDREEDNLLKSIKDNLVTPVYAATNGEILWKNYGNRYFTASYTAAIGAGTIRYVFENHYRLSANGIRELEGIPLHTWMSVIETATITNPVREKITDEYATKPGASNVNMYCTFKYEMKMGSAGGGEFKFATAIDYLAINKADKKIKVKHYWKLTFA